MKAMDMRKRIDLELRGKDPETVCLFYINLKNLFFYT